jgi:hypothetical protein
MARIRNHLTLCTRNKTLNMLTAKLAQYLAPQVYQMIFSGDADVSIKAQRKELTIAVATPSGYEDHELLVLFTFPESAEKCLRSRTG